MKLNLSHDESHPSGTDQGLPWSMKKFTASPFPVLAAPHTTIRNGGKDISLNVSLKDLLIRFGLTVFIPVIVLLINVHLVIYTAPVVAYLFITTLTRFCVIKYLWHYYVL